MRNFKLILLIVLSLVAGYAGLLLTWFLVNIGLNSPMSFMGSHANYKPVYAITTALPWVFIAFTWLDLFLGTNILNPGIRGGGQEAEAEAPAE